MSKTKSNVPKSKRGGYDLWGKRPCSGTSVCPDNKRLCRRMERRRKHLFIKQNMEENGIT